MAEKLICAVCGIESSNKLFSSMATSTLFFERLRNADYCPKCAVQVKLSIANSIITTTTNSISGYIIESYLGVESVEVVLGTGVISESISEVSDFFGTRSTVFETKLQQAKKIALNKIKLLADSLGGNAIVGMDIDYTEFTGNRIGVIINGTVVKVIKDYNDERILHTF